MRRKSDRSVRFHGSTGLGPCRAVADVPRRAAILLGSSILACALGCAGADFTSDFTFCDGGGECQKDKDGASGPDAFGSSSSSASASGGTAGEASSGEGGAGLGGDGGSLSSASQSGSSSSSSSSGSSSTGSGGSGGAPSCGPATCPAGCCDAQGACQPGSADDACGELGGACDACANTCGWAPPWPDVCNHPSGIAYVGCVQQVCAPKSIGGKFGECCGGSAGCSMGACPP